MLKGDIMEKIFLENLKINIENFPKHLNEDMFILAVHFVISQLFKNLNKTLTINIVFKYFSKHDGEAYCLWEDTNRRPREFEIGLHKRRGMKSTLYSLAHELVHVEQYSKGRLTDHIKTETTLWKGKLFQNSGEFETFEDFKRYYNFPWEIEAHGKEIGLIKLFKIYYKAKL
jgi:hypothetical protein